MNGLVSSGSHIHLQVFRHAVEQRVVSIKAVAILLSERERGQQRMKFVKLMITQFLHRFVDLDII